MLDRIGEANVERLNSQPEPPPPAAILQEGLQLIAEAETIKREGATRPAKLRPGRR